MLSYINANVNVNTKRTNRNLKKDKSIRKRYN